MLQINNLFNSWSAYSERRTKSGARSFSSMTDRKYNKL